MGGFARFWLGRAISHGRTTLTIWRNGRKAAKSRKAHRHQKVDRETTSLRLYLDKRSFVNLEGQIFLAGQDMSVQRDAAMARDSFRCVECGCTFNLQVHHIKSRGMGGDDSLGNLETLCMGCHAKRHVRPQFSGNGAKA